MNHILERFLEHVEKTPGHSTFVHYEDGREICVCRRDFMNAVLSVQEWLARRRIGPVVFLLSENRYEWILVHIAIICGEGMVVSLDPQLPAEELCAQIRKAGRGTVLYSADYSPLSAQISDSLPNQAFVSMEEESFQTAIHAAAPVCSATTNSADEEAPAMLAFTSGTMAGGKGVALSRRNLYSLLSCSGQAIDFTENDRTAVLLPLHHVYGCAIQLYVPLFTGGCVCLVDGLKRFTAQLRRLRVTILCIVPALARALLAELDAFSTPDELDSGRLLPDLRLCYCGGAALPREVLWGLIAHGFPVVEGYGATECTGLISANPLRMRQPGTVGRIYPSCRVRIASDGEIQVSGGNVMSGYWQDPAATQAVMTVDGWFCTGDLGTLSDDGYVTVYGRKKSLLLLENGKKIFPEELEEQLEQLPAVTEALAYTEENRLCVLVFSTDIPAAKQSLDRWSRTQPDWRRPGKFLFRDTPLPRSGIGKKKRGMAPCQNG